MKPFRFAFTLWACCALAFGAQAETPRVLSQEFVGVYGFENCDRTDREEDWVIGQSFEFFRTDSVTVAPLKITGFDGTWHRLRDPIAEELDYFVKKDQDAVLLVFAENETPPEAWPPAGIKRSNDSFTVFRYERCESVSDTTKLVFGETIDVMQDLDRAVTSCQSDLTTCSQSLFEASDVHPNKALSRAELSRIVRFLMVVATANSESEDSNLAQVGAALASSYLAAPAIAQILLLNHDFDASHDLTLEELVSGRLHDTYMQGLSHAEDDWFKVLGEVADSAMELSKALPLLR